MKQHEEFVERFREEWRSPLDKFVQLFHPEGRLFQQGMEHAIGRDEIPAHIAAVHALIPDQQVTVERWAGRDDDVFIEWTASATFRGQPISWTGASRFTLRRGLIFEEVAYFDTLPLRALVDPSIGRANLVATAQAATE